MYLSPIIDCYDDRIIAYTAGFNPNTEPCRQDACQGRGDTAGGSVALGALGLWISLPAVRQAPLFSFISSGNDCAIISKKTSAAPLVCFLV